ncbi:hypothetical protein Q0M94_12085 [Deinococcus radiomollis]|uniref:hypothetical protein n=1 Tax=Deinococcus radiomollis TaxID=468916 RepID=UPI00389247A8
MPALSETIAALFERAATEPKAEGTVQRGLNLKARIVNGQRQLLLSRPDMQPSDVEVTTCAKHGGIAAYTVSHAGRWQLILEATDLCDHTPGFSGSGDAKGEYFYYGSCSTCHARWRRTVPKRGKGDTFTYNGQQVEEWQLALLSKRGPKADRATESDGELELHEFLEKTIVRQQLDSQPVVDTAPALTGQVCGTCRNGLPTQYPNEVECQLGWDAHDKQPKGYDQKTKKAVPVHLPHGSLALPILTPGHRCVTDRWLPA